jgi:hypothetical protein
MGRCLWTSPTSGVSSTTEHAPKFKAWRRSSSTPSARLVYAPGVSFDVEIRAAYSREDVERGLRRLTANLMRIVRGAGKPYELMDELDALVTAINEYYQHSKQPLNLASMLAMAPEEPILGYDVIVSGALRTVAARILGERTQERLGENEIAAGIRYREEALNRRDWK